MQIMSCYTILVTYITMISVVQDTILVAHKGLKTVTIKAKILEIYHD